MKPLCGMPTPGGNSTMLTTLKVGVCVHVLERPPRHLFLSLVGEQRGSIFQPHPAGACYLYSHSRRNIVDAAGAVTHQVETHNFEYARPVPPGACIHVFTVAELSDRLRP